MTISGFTFIKNATKLYIPVKESICSILPICDEFIIAIGDNDPDDKTDELIASINSDKIKIIRTVWDTKAFPKNTEFARQTDLAKAECTGDWLFYIQADEAIHENKLDLIQSSCEKYLQDKKVDGFLFNYLHFWGNYERYHYSHSWYKKEIRIIRNEPDIHSWKDAQSFRRFSKWDGSFEDYQKTENTQKLNVRQLDAQVFHYGYVRPPKLMTEKRKVNSRSYHGKLTRLIESLDDVYDYGNLSRLYEFTATHPAVMKDWIAKFDWEHLLRYEDRKTNRDLFKHERFKYRLISWIENNLFGGKVIGGFENYGLVKD